MTTAKIDVSVEQMLAWADKQPKAVLCEVCGKELTHGGSKARGIGPICRGKLDAAEREYDAALQDKADAEHLDWTRQQREGQG